MKYQFGVKTTFLMLLPFDMKHTQAIKERKEDGVNSHFSP